MVTFLEFDLEGPDQYRLLVEWFDRIGVAIRNDMMCILQDFTGFSKHASFLRELVSKDFNANNIG